VGRHYRINNIWNQNNDTTMNVPGDNVVTDVIPPGGGGSQYKSDGPTVLPSSSPLCGKTLLYQQYLEKEKGGKYRTGKLASNVTSQCLYHDVFTMYLRHFLPNDLYFLSIISSKLSLIQRRRHIGAPVNLWLYH
jgi:hypothetical protein